MDRSRKSLTGHSYVPWFYEAVAAVICWIFYRITAIGPERLPRTGGVVLVANHLSFLDVVVLQFACPRPIRYIGHAGLRKSGFINWVFETAHVIPLDADEPIDAMRESIRSLKAGDVVCIFAEGSISRNGQLLEIKKGFEMLARRAGVPVVPVAIDGVWGSIFSFSESKYLWKTPRMMPFPIVVAFGEPIPPDAADRTTVRRAILDLGAVAFEQRPVLKRHLGGEAVRSLAKRPWRERVIDRTGDRRALKGGELLAAAAALSRHLRATVPGKRVGIVLPPGAGAVIANLAVVCAGKIPVNLNFTAGQAAIESSLRRGGISTVLSATILRSKIAGFPWPEDTRDLSAEMKAAGGKRAMLPWLVAAWLLPNFLIPKLLGVPESGGDEEAALLFTSGSSGEPKGVVLTHRNLLGNCDQVSSLSILPDNGTLVGCLPIFHSFGFLVTLWYPLIRGCRLVTVPSPLETRKIIDAIRDEEATAMLGAPTFIRPFLKKATSADLRSLHLVVTGAEKLPADLQESFQRLFHIDIMQGYGLTETSPASCLNQPDSKVEDGESQAGSRAGSVGRLLPGMTARVVDPDTGAELPLTSTGLLLLRGPNIFAGYLDDPERTRAAIRNGWFVTGDLGRFDDDGFLFIEGRQSRFSKLAGEMVPHGTVEQRIVGVFGWDESELPAAVVIGIPDPDKGEALVLIATVRVAADDLRRRLQDTGLPALWIPRIVIHSERIPMLGTGKIDFRACRDLALRG